MSPKSISSIKPWKDFKKVLSIGCDKCLLVPQSYGMFLNESFINKSPIKLIGTQGLATCVGVYVYAPKGGHYVAHYDVNENIKEIVMFHLAYFMDIFKVEAGDCQVTLVSQKRSNQLCISLENAFRYFNINNRKIIETVQDFYADSNGKVNLVDYTGNETHQQMFVRLCSLQNKSTSDSPEIFKLRINENTPAKIYKRP